MNTKRESHNVGDIVFLKLRADDVNLRTGLIVHLQHANENACIHSGMHWQTVSRLREYNFIVFVPDVGLIGPSPFAFVKPK